MKKRLAVLLSGRGSNFRTIKARIDDGSIPNAEIALVITNKADAAGFLFAQESGLNAVYVNPKEYENREAFDAAVLGIIDSHNIDLVVLAGYMRILSTPFVTALTGKIINIHPSLLPSFPGLHAQKQAVDYGVRHSGCTVHFVDAGVDTGPIILQAVVPVLQGDTEETLSERILVEEHKLYPKAVQLITDGKVELTGRTVVIHE